jgi:hypothetical protein
VLVCVLVCVRMIMLANLFTGLINDITMNIMRMVVMV